MSSDIENVVLGDVIELGVKRALEKAHTSFPGEVVDYDATNQTATIQPVVKGKFVDLDQNITYYDLPPIPSVPVLFPQVKRYGIFFDIEPGDTVLVVCCERSISEWMTIGRAGVESKEARRNHLTDAIAIPGIMPLTNIIGNAPTDRISMRQSQRNGSPSEPARIEVTSDGKIVIGNGVVELLDMLHRWFDAHKTAYVNTGIGVQKILYGGAQFLDALAVTLDGELDQVREP